MIVVSVVNVLYKRGIFPFKKAPAENSDINNLPGRWYEIEEENSGIILTEEQKEMIEQLETVGYISGSKPAPQRRNVTKYEKESAYNGVNLIVSGHAPEAILIDMEGNELHKWSCDAYRAWPAFEPKEDKQHTFWRRAHLMENGDLLVIFDGIGLIKLDKDSNILWSQRNGAHHDLYVARNGSIYVLTRKAHINKKYNEEKPVLEDYVSRLDSFGREIRRISVLDVLENSAYSPVLHRLKSWGDILHTNTIELIEDTVAVQSPAFEKGNVLISIYWLDLVCVIDFDEESVVWGESDLWEKQHQPTILENGNILVFDNLGAKSHSRVIEFDPISREASWLYGSGEGEHFYTPTCGSCQRLPNGNTLITESDPGRAFEVTRDKTVVWEYVNPHRAGKNHELIATLFEVVRLGPDFPMDWLQ